MFIGPLWILMRKIGIKPRENQFEPHFYLPGPCVDSKLLYSYSINWRVTMLEILLLVIILTNVKNIRRYYTEKPKPKSMIYLTDYLIKENRMCWMIFWKESVKAVANVPKLIPSPTCRNVLMQGLFYWRFRTISRRFGKRYYYI